MIGMESWPKEWETNGNVAWIFALETERSFYRRVLSSLEGLEKKHNIRLWIGGRDFPLHVSVHSAKIPDAQDIENLYDSLENDAGIRAQAARFRGRKFEFNHLLYDNGNVILVSNYIPSDVDTFRRQCAAHMDRLGFGQGKFREGILHVTLARIRTMPVDISETREQGRLLLKFATDLETIGRSFSEGVPIEVIVAGTFLGRGSNLIYENSVSLRARSV